jgi:hypothetical protein
MILNVSFPGVGSYLAGWRTTGLVQMLVAAAGFVLTNIFAFWFCRLWYTSGVFPLVTLLRDGRVPDSWWRPLQFGFVGVVLFMVAFVWGLLTGLALLRAERR